MTGNYRKLGPEGFGTYDAQGRRIAQDTDANLMVPGFVDLHIHGGFGIDFMSASSEEMLRLFGQLRRVGYEGLLPTTVTASSADVLAVLQRLPEHPMVLGFHLEGPFISPVYPGAQPQEFILPPTDASDPQWAAVLNDPRLRVVTLAPELPGALDLIYQLRARGVRASIGHTNATFQEANAAHAVGAVQTTHTYNAMRPLHHREAGTVGFALLTDSLATELIYDRKHVSPPAARLLVRSKPDEMLLAVSDGTMAAGLPAGSKITMWGLECIVGEHEVRLTDGTLAGSGITLLDAFRNLHDDFGPEVAIRATSLNPRRALKLDREPTVYVEFDRRLELVAIHEPTSSE